MKATRMPSLRSKEGGLESYLSTGRNNIRREILALSLRGTLGTLAVSLSTLLSMISISY